LDLEGRIQKHSITLISPTNATTLSTIGTNFTANFNSTYPNTNEYVWKNATFNVYHQNGTLFDSNFTTLSGNNTQSTRLISDFSVGNYYWNVLGWYGNATFSNSTTSNNFTFDVGALLIDSNYDEQVYETSRENFYAEFSLIEGAEISLVQLIYNDAEYVITDINQSNTTLLISKDIDIPLNINPLANQTNNFTFQFTYEGGFIQETEVFQQNSSFINLVICGSGYTTTSLDFTLKDEKTLQPLVASENLNTNLETYFKYWLGSGDVYKNYSYQLLNSSTTSNYQFCIHPYLPDVHTFRASLDSQFSATDYSQNEYYLRNATLTNSTIDFPLYLWVLDEDSSTKFYVTVKRGITFVPNVLVNIAKFFIGQGEYQTVSRKITDGDGRFPFYAELDSNYLWTVVDDDGNVLGSIEKVASCPSSPCEIEIQISDETTSFFESYDDVYATNVVSSLTFNPETEIVTYNFIDTSGLAQYFRLEVQKTSNNDSSGQIICDKTSYSVAGIITCNVTGYNGNFFARGYISKSPEKLDKVLSFFISDALRELGIWAIFLNIAIIITMVFVSAASSRGNPSVIVFILAITILLLKLGGLFPFSWIVVTSIEVGLIFLLMRLKT